MKTRIILNALFLIITCSISAQVQLGQTIYGNNQSDQEGESVAISAN